MSLGFYSNVIRGQLYKRAKTRRFSQSSKSTNEEECRLSAKPEASFTHKIMNFKCKITVGEEIANFFRETSLPFDCEAN